MIHGFVRGDEDDNLMIKDILDMIIQYYMIDYIYLMHGGGELWKVDMDDILYPAVNELSTK